MDLPARPLRLAPMRLGRPWGGGRFGVAGDEPIGELWVSGDDATLPDGRTLRGSGLAGLVPLVKILDVGGRLSVQVHPDDAAAVELRGPGAVGKHECWVVLEAPTGAMVALGLAPGASADDLFSGHADRIERALRAQPVAPGTVLDIAPGTVHAPGGGLLLYEVQQRSDLTFRIWDWGRPRPLHPAESRRCLRPDAKPWVAALPADLGSAVVSAPDAPFRLVSIRLGGPGDVRALQLDTPGLLSILHGTLTIGPEAGATGGPGDELEAGSHWFVPPGRWSLGGTGDALVASWPAGRGPVRPG